ncbi:oligosaccharide flippase family protein [Cyanobacterium aponinum AL20118]|uniref:Oligosaccharide flippase family protein n=1 Tax=Cyanobacterium aponinum AL20115 TaxID=3090662 RepID=A0AAF1C179_9CHRO|nr:oligosaccharide flippase family protein [Cyanobacterium aponinum]WPF88372.1 oligosaccharide flippase family protein [Cyanobacterium aponinum AL20115]
MSISIRTLLKHSSYLFMGSMGSMVLRLVQNILVARALGPSQLGAWSTIVSFCSIIQAFSSFRTQEALTKYLVEFKTNKEDAKLELLLATAMIIDIGTALLAVIVVTLLAPFVASNLTQGEGKPILFLLYAISFLSNSFNNTWYCVARDLRQLGKQSLRQIILTVLQVIGVVLLYAVGNLTIYSLALLIAFNSIINFISVFFFLAPELKKGYNIDILDLPWTSYGKSFKELKEFWHFLSYTYVSTTFSGIIKNVDIIMLGRFSTNFDVGIYQLAKSLTSVVQIAIQSLASVVYQDFNELIAHKKSNIILNELLKISKKLISLQIIITVIILYFAPTIIKLIYGENFIATYPIFAIFMIDAFVGAFLFWSQSLVISLKGYVYKLKVTIYSIVIYFILIALLTPTFASIGMAIAYSITFVGVNLAFAVKSISMLKKMNGKL